MYDLHWGLWVWVVWCSVNPTCADAEQADGAGPTSPEGDYQVSCIGIVTFVSSGTHGIQFCRKCHCNEEPGKVP